MKGIEIKFNPAGEKISEIFNTTDYGAE